MLTIFLLTCGYLHGLYFIIKMPDEISMCSHAPAKALFANVQVATSCGSRERERERETLGGAREREKQIEGVRERKKHVKNAHHCNCNL